VREVIFAGFREMHVVAHPLCGVLARVVGFRIVGGADELRRWRNVVGLASVQPGAVPQIVLYPHPAQDGNSGNVL
jgi:hypothetical protein